LDCKTHLEIVENSYKLTKLDYELIKKECESKNCFVKVNPNEYPKRLDFEKYWHTLYKEKKQILKENHYSIIMVNQQIIYISDFFLKEEFQKKGIGKKLIKSMLLNIEKKYGYIKFISLKSLPKSVLRWFKIGFNFYNPSDEKKVKHLIYKKIGKKVDISKLSYDEVVKYEIESLLEKSFKNYIPMWIRI